MSPPDLNNPNANHQQHGLGGRHGSTASEGAQQQGAFDVRHDSTASESGRNFRRGISTKEKSNQDIADHFMYQVPSSLNSTTDEYTGGQEEEVYQNAAGNTCVILYRKYQQFDFILKLNLTSQ